VCVIRVQKFASAVSVVLTDTSVLSNFVAIAFSIVLRWSVGHPVAPAWF